MEQQQAAGAPAGQYPHDGGAEAMKKLPWYRRALVRFVAGFLALMVSFGAGWGVHDLVGARQPDTGANTSTTPDGRTSDERGGPGAPPGSDGLKGGHGPGQMGGPGGSGSGSGSVPGQTTPNSTPDSESDSGTSGGVLQDDSSTSAGNTSVSQSIDSKGATA